MPFLSSTPCAPTRGSRISSAASGFPHSRLPCGQEHQANPREPFQCPVGQTLLSVQIDIATAHPDRQECLSYQNVAARKRTRYLMAFRSGKGGIYRLRRSRWIYRRWLGDRGKETGEVALF